MDDTTAFWEDLYTSRAEGGNIWSGNANAPLVSAVEGLPPGRALDLGCGEGGDAVHLARLGWQVTAVDVSPTALARTRALAEAAGVASLVTTEQHDLARSFPTGRFDLVVALFFQSPIELPRERVLRQAVESLEVSGRLVLVEHGSMPTWSQHQHDHHFPSPDELVASLDLDPARFTPLTVESWSRDATGPDGETGTLLDTVVVVRRTA
ncbi:MAG TPA: class I SAM-dependent methyltransferase [Candidatus Nanopelagicales bacterium]|nr:class I SAM-dependent methyltransferase [Candidatus Nanopelagicales bacterium]